MEILRTPDDRFASLPGYDFAPDYTFLRHDAETEIRVHSIDEGRGAPLPRVPA